MNRTLVTRYWPFAVLVALQVLLVTLGSDDVEMTAGSTFSVDGGSAAPGQLSSGGGQFNGQTGSSGVASGGVAAIGTGATPSAGAGGGQGSTTAGGAGQVPDAGPQAAGGGTPTAPDSVQQLDALGRPLDGDRSKCGKDGILQEDVTHQSPPCMPAFAGNNGGATYQGVDAETIKVVMYYPEYDPAVQQTLAANGLAVTRAQAEELHTVLEEFVNSNHEFFGREIELITHMASASDAIAMRAEAKAVAQKHKPFAVLYYVQGTMPAVMADELARQGIVNTGVSPLADDFFIERAPFVWSQVIQGYRIADMTADYYCKRMHGKPASLAGDPSMRVKTRKIGVGATEDPHQLKTAQRFISQITGGMCGSPDDGVTLYTRSSDPTTAANQLPALVSRMKSDGITTTYRIDVCAEGDNQGYFPENLQSQVFDDDLTGRFFAAFCSPTQMSNAFGIGMFPQGVPPEEMEFTKATRSVRPDYDPPYITEGPFQALMFFTHLVQYAGPNLNPQTLYQGSRSMHQTGGWQNPNPWPGWECCNIFTPQYNVGMAPDSFTPKADARQVYWDSAAISPTDGAAGAWVGVDNSRRYMVGQWTKGEPKQP